MAETIPATYETPQRIFVYYAYTGANTRITNVYGEGQPACDQAKAGSIFMTSPVLGCYENKTNPGKFYDVMKTDGCNSGGFKLWHQCTPVYTCPNGYTLNGTSCSRVDCPLGYDYSSNGQCVKNCTAKANTPTTNGNYDFPGPPSEWSVAGCKVRCKQRVIQYNGGAGYQCYYTGASANPDQPEPEMLPPDPTKLPPESPKDCLNQGQGYVQSSSGSVKCVSGESAPAGQKPKAVESDHSETTGEDTDGDGVPDKNVKKTEGTTTKDDKGEVTDKKTESMDPNADGTCNAGFIKNTSTGKCEKTTVEKKDLNSFCTDKPDHEICTGKKPAPDPCTENKDRVGCADLGTAPEGVEPGTKDIGVSAITPFAMGGNASCPADIQGPKGITIPFTGVCMYAQGIRPIILALAWIFAGWMVVGAFKS